MRQVFFFIISQSAHDHKHNCTGVLIKEGVPIVGKLQRLKRKIIMRLENREEQLKELLAQVHETCEEGNEHFLEMVEEEAEGSGCCACVLA